MAIVLIGIDDTDNLTSPGTGKLSRRLCGEIEQRGARPLGITRHQFLLDERIAYTTHNSGACIAVEWDRPLNDLQFAIDLIAEWAAEGSDPGICIAEVEKIPREIIEWGRAATSEVLTRAGATVLATAHGICLQELGGSGDGIIGALASVGQRAGGQEGRFLDLPGLRSLGEIVRLEELTALGIEVQHGDSGDARSAYKTLDWVRPRLSGGRPVLPVEWSDYERAWVPVDRKRSRPLE